MDENYIKWLLKHPIVDYMQRVLRHSKSKDFRDMILSYHRDPNLIYFRENGEDYPESYFYDIFLDYPSKGFFAILLQTLDALWYGDHFSLVPVVTWSDNCLYKDAGKINGSENPFEYYFEPTSNYSKSDIVHGKHVLPYHACQRRFDKEHSFSVVSKTIVESDCYDEYILRNARTWSKHIKLKPQVMEYITTSLNRFDFLDKTLGVHVRATDFNNHYINHAVAVQENEYLEAVKRALEENPFFEQIFLATDDQDTVDVFRSSFNKKVICYGDVFRSTDGEAVHFSSSQRKQHKYNLGLEVLRDAYTLASCEGLIGSYSNVCIAAQVIKGSFDKKYRYIDIIDKGFNQTGKTTKEDRFGRRPAMKSQA